MEMFELIHQHQGTLGIPTRQWTQCRHTGMIPRTIINTMETGVVAKEEVVMAEAEEMARGEAETTVLDRMTPTRPWYNSWN